MVGRIDAVKMLVADDEKRLKQVQSTIKDICAEKFRAGDKQVVVSGGKYDWITSRSVTVKIDKDKMKEDGILDQYSSEETSFTLRKKERS